MQLNSGHMDQGRKFNSALDGWRKIVNSVDKQCN